MILAPFHAGWPEIGIFVLANAIIFWICLPPLLNDIRRWRA